MNDTNDMKALYNRIGSLELAKELALSDKTVFIYEVPEWQVKKEGKSRGFHCREELNPVNVISIKYERKGVDAEKAILESFAADFSTCGSESYDSLDIESMRSFLDKVNARFRSLIVDITLINIRLLGAFLAVLPYYDWEKVYFCYTEPGQYMPKDKGNDEENDENGPAGFDLKYSMQGFDEIPNLQTMVDNTTDCEWIIFMGFEGSRLIKLNWEAEPNRRYIIPVMCIPAMHIEWHNYAMEVNMPFLDSVGETEHLKYVSAVNPFEIYNFLIEEKKQADLRLKISPVGTKLTVLGSIMYIIESEEDMILTDNPYQEDENSVDFGNSYLYDLTYFIRNVENRRFERREN